MCCNENCFDKCTFIRLFLSQIFDFGYSCGSLIYAAIGIFRIFQRLSATISFKTKFSPDCLAMFSWATQLVKIFTSLIETNPFDDYDNFNFYTLIIPITIIVYFAFIIIDEYLLFLLYFIVGLSIMFGAGFGFIGVNGLIAGLLIPLPIILFLIMYCCYCHDECCKCCCCCCSTGCHCCCKKDKEKKDIKTAIKDLSSNTIKDIKLEKFFYALPPTCFLFYALMIPLMLNRSELIKVFTIIIGVFTFVYAAVFFILECYFSTLFEKIEEAGYFGQIGDKIINFLINILSLLIIPSSKYFIQLMKSKYKNDWRCILSYIVLSLLLPLLLTLFNILIEHNSITDKYKSDKAFFYYIELIDIFRQLLYAILAGYDVIWACLVVDIAWAIFIAVFRPYLNLSEYILTWGNCLVTLISNSVIIHANRNHIESFGLTVTIILVILGCLPAIASMYVFFCYDFSIDVKSLNNQEIKMNAFNLVFTTILAPFSWFLYGINLSLIDKKVFKQNI